ncbi:MAG: ribose transport system permease protein [Verrucomicrobiales bacterium]|jgi:ribose transport system permease protein
MKKIREKYQREIGMLILLIVLMVVTTLINPKFLSLANFSNVSKTIGVYGILSIAVGTVIITSGIDLSIGSLLALLGTLFFYMLTGEPKWLPSSFPWGLAVFIVIVLGLAVGAIHGFFIGKVKMQAFVVTLCGLLSYRGLARTLSNDSQVGYSAVSDDLATLKVLGDGSLGQLLFGEQAAESGFLSQLIYSIPMTFIYLIIIAVVMGVVLHRSVFGRYLYATGRNEEAARYSGINTKLVICAAYVICGGLVAFASIPYALFTGSVTPSGHGSFVELYAIAGAVLGGCALKGGEGTIVGIVIGAVILVLLQNIVNMLGLPSSLTDFIIGGVLFVGVLLNQMGIAGIKRMIGLGSKKPA